MKEFVPEHLLIRLFHRDEDGIIRKPLAERQAFADACGIRLNMVEVNQQNGELQVKAVPVKARNAERNR